MTRYFRNTRLIDLISGLTSFEEIIDGAVEAFNMDRDLAAALTAFGMVSPLGIHSSSSPNLIPNSLLEEMLL